MKNTIIFCAWAVATVLGGSLGRLENLRHSSEVRKTVVKLYENLQLQSFKEDSVQLLRVLTS